MLMKLISDKAVQEYTIQHKEELIMLVIASTEIEKLRFRG